MKYSKQEQDALEYIAIFGKVAAAQRIAKLEKQVDNHNQVAAECVRLLDNVRSVLDNPAEVTDEFRLERIDVIVNGEKNE